MTPRKNAHLRSDPSLVDQTLNFLDIYYRFWHRVELIGGNSIPYNGGAIFFGNHAGFNMLDILMTMVAIRKNTASRRLLRGIHHRDIEKNRLASDFVLHRLGGVIGSQDNAKILLHEGEAILTYPEGANSTSKKILRKKTINTYR